MSQFRVRPMEERDDDACDRLHRESGSEMVKPQSEVLVAEDEAGQVVGYASFMVMGSQAVGLDVASTEAGAGKALAHTGFVLAKKMGATFAMAACKNHLVSWHLRLGYEVCGYSRSYYPSGEDAVIMRREL